jgi:small subunit ribosomal protein S16
MAVKIRLTRAGTTKRPFYRIIATNSRSPRDGKMLEILGTYDPKNLSIPKGSSQAQAKGLVNVKTDRILYWLGVGAVLTPTVKSLFERLKLSKAA